MHGRVVVIGGGIAGLVAAADLARGGAAPVLLEAAPELGGRAQTRVIDGFCFNQGPHALYAAGAFKAALDELGVAVPGGRPDVTKGLALWDDGAHASPLAPTNGGPPPPLDEAETALLWAQFGRIAQGDYDGRGQSLRTFTGPWPERVRAMIEALVRLATYANAPDLMDAKAALDQVRLSFAGVIYVDGGWATLVDGLAAAARQAGAELRTQTRASAVVRAERGWRVEVVGEAPIACDGVILAVPPAVATEIAPASKSLAAAVSGLSPARIMGLDLGLSPGVSPRASFALGVTSPTYVSLHSDVAKLASEGGTLAHLARYLAPDEAPSLGAFDELERLADDLLPDWRSHEVRRQRLMGLTVSHHIPGWRTAGRRAEVCIADAPGLYLAGDWVGDQGLLADAAAASARVAATQALALLAEIPALTTHG